MFLQAAGAFYAVHEEAIEIQLEIWQKSMGHKFPQEHTWRYFGAIDLFGRM